MPGSPQHTDRRVQRTHDALLESLRTLMSERGYERLTIQNLLEHSGVSRATFYTHFTSKDDLLATSVGGLRSWLQRAAAQRGGERMPYTLPFLQHLESHKPLYRQCMRRGEIAVGREIRTMLRDLIRDDLVRETGAARDALSVAFTTEFRTGALWSFVAHWMREVPELSAVDADRMFRRLVFPEAY